MARIELLTVDNEELKQKVEEYVSKNSFGDDYNNIISSEANSEIKKAYIAGAIENCIKWHDLRKVPNDLPKEIRNGRSKVVLGDNGELIYFNHKTNWWKDYSDHERYPPVAWCEIPQFKE